MQMIIKYTLSFLIFVLFLIFIWFFWGSPKKSEKMYWGANFSLKQATFLDLDPKEVYLAMLDDLRIRNLKISVHWDLMQPESNIYDFTDLDWQVAEAEKRNINLILAIGMKTPRWPECHLPQWAMNLSKKEQQQKILTYLETIVLRYKNSSTISMWQVENEPFLQFGACPWSDEGFLKKEVALVKQLDPERKIIITDSGEMSTWTRVAQIGDVVGFTTYRNVWQDQLKFYLSYSPWITPMCYYRRAEIVQNFYNKKVIGTELQAEPWCPNSVWNTSIEEQQKTMSLSKLQESIAFAKSTGIDTYYLWGAEWWYWMKTKQNHGEYWQEIKNIISE